MNISKIANITFIYEILKMLPYIYILKLSLNLIDYVSF